MRAAAKARDSQAGGVAAAKATAAAAAGPAFEAPLRSSTGRERAAAVRAAARAREAEAKKGPPPLLPAFARGAPKRSSLVERAGALRAAAYEKAKAEQRQQGAGPGGAGALFEWGAKAMSRT